MLDAGLSVVNEDDCQPPAIRPTLIRHTLCAYTIQCREFCSPIVDSKD